jgi:hypothetical protein
MVGRSYEELSGNEEFRAKAERCENAQELQALAASYGLHGTIGEASRAFDRLQSVQADKAISEDQLDAVAGGVGDVSSEMKSQSDELDSVSGKKGPRSNRC